MKILVILTGASRGIGKQISNTLLKHILVLLTIAQDDKQQQQQQQLKRSCHDDNNIMIVKNHIHFHLIARSNQDLTETSALLQSSYDNFALHSSTEFKITSHTFDLSDLHTLEQNINNLFQTITNNIQHVAQEDTISPSEFYDRVVLINNAGSLGPLGSPFITHTSHSNNNTTTTATTSTPLNQNSFSLSMIQNAIDLNITSCLFLSSRFIQYFSPLTSCASHHHHHPARNVIGTIVNISSLCALQPFKTMSVYCAVKSARDMFHLVLAKEINDYNATLGNKNHAPGQEQEQPNESSSSSRPWMKLLSYAPGPIDTEMTDSLINCDELDTDLHKFYKTSKENDTFVDIHDSVQRLVTLIFRDDFVSGDHIDYYDLDAKV